MTARLPRFEPSCQVLLQGYLAVQALGAVVVIVLDPATVARMIAEQAGPFTWLFLGVLAASAGLLLLDLATPNRLRRLTRIRHLLGVGLMFGWASQAFLAAHFWATGYMALYSINALFLAVWVVMDAADRGGCGGPRDSAR